MLDTLKRYLRYTSWPILASVVALMTLGVLAIRASEQADPDMTGFAAKQMAFAGAGIVVFIAATSFPYARLGRLAYPLFGATLVLLVAVFYLPDVRGSHRWIDLKVVRFQPSELAKLTFIILLAWYLRYGDHYRRLGGLIIPFLLTLVPMGLILKEPDLGTALLFLPTLYFMLFLAGAKLRHLLTIVGLGTLVVLLPVPRGVDAETFQTQRDGGRFETVQLGPVKLFSVDRSLPWRQQPEVPAAYCRFQIGEGRVFDLQPLSLRVLKGHQSRRIEGWLRQNDPRIEQGKGYQLSQSKIVLGAGKLTGRGEWGDADATFRMLPDDHTDFIYSVVGGQWGFLGCLFVLALYGVIFVFGVEIAVLTYDPFGRLLAVGVLALLLSQVVINVGMTMGLMPITGMTLPLVSYGGSSLVVNCAALGLLVNIGQRRPILLGRRPFEYGERGEKPPAPYGPLAD
ncbi:MAG TPA: rod shape-determining protein RodA [Phycisphaerales bacterium]|nr:rod shape-determining protein RodA [Phycisphaerales bacterium]